ncbi:MAG: hypothetical protein QOE83_219 [Actinomycetota bacterium]|nr:hypothetical protein [Actinomycetota bacterium]
MDLGDGERILAVDLAPTTGSAAGRATHVSATVGDVVYLGSVTQLIVGLRTGERVTVHRLNDEVGAEDPGPATGSASSGQPSTAS